VPSPSCAMVTKTRTGGIPWRLVAVLLGAALCLLWVCAQLALQPSCQLDEERTARAEELVYRLQQQTAATRGETEAKEEELQRRIHELEQQLEEARAKLSQLPPAAPAWNNAGPSQGAAQLSLPDPAVVPSSGVGSLRGSSGRSVGSKITEDSLRTLASSGAIAVALIVCKRPQYLKRTMDGIFRAQRDSDKFPLIISQDAFDDAMTRHVESSYVETGLAYHMHHTHEANAQSVASKFGSGKQAKGYVLIAQHFGFVMRRLIDDFGFGAITFIEEDIEVAPDIFSYFGAMLPLVRADPDLYCVSAWNDNGYDTLVEDPRLAFRTEFFPGLGWMMDRSLWDEVRDRWAEAYWDEFMRRADVRKGRHCIRPEISRTFTFGEEGISAGQFFKQHLSRIKLNTEQVDWASEDVGYLASASAFEEYIGGEIRAATETALAQADHAGPGPIRIRYDDKREYQAVANKFSLMKDEKEGIRRMAYRGMIPFAWQGHRVYLYTNAWPSMQ